MKDIYEALLSLFFPGKKRLKLLPVKSFSFYCVLIISIALFACGNATKKGKINSTASQDVAKPYGFISMAPRQAVLISEFPAIIQGQQNIEIRPRIDGYLQALYVDEGAVVKKGQLLFKISAPLYEQGVRTAVANVKIAQADLNAAQMEVNKVQPLVDKNIISSYELQAAKFTLQSKQAALAQAQAALTNAKTNLSFATISSPVNGVIGVTPFNIGSLVGSTNTQPLTTVSNIGNIYAYFSINEKSAFYFFTHAKGNNLQQQLATFPPVTMVLPNGIPFNHKGQIQSIGGLVNVGTGSVSLRATFPNPEGLIRSGSSATIQIPTTMDNALLVPQSATYQIQGKIFVYVIGTDSLVHSTAIQVNSNTAGHSYVVEKGLKVGDKVVVEGIGNLRDGLSVQPKAMNADSVYTNL